jgi:predicted outer membrane repeat protein
VKIVSAMGLIAAVGSTVGLGAGVPIAVAADAKVQAASEDELRAAFADPQVEHIAVTADVVLTCGGGDGGALRRDSGTALVVSGGGHVLVQSCPEDRIMTTSGGGALMVEGLTLTGGVCDGDGGAIFTDGEVAIVGSTLHDNTSARQGGAVYSTGRVTVDGSTLRNNRAGLGGGAVAARDDITVVGSLLHDNRGDVREYGRPNRDACTPTTPSGPWETYGAADGGAVRGLRSVEVADSILRDNRAGRDGGAILAERDITLLESTVAGNAAANAGGAVRAFGTVVVTDTTIIGNEAGSAGGAVQAFRTVTVTGSTLHDNRSGGSGGAIMAAADAVLENVTLTGNQAGGSGGGLAMEAGGNLVLRHATVVENEASTGANLALGRARLVPFGSVVALPIGSPNCRSFGAAAVSAGFNVSDDDSCGLDHETDRWSAEVLLSPLADNGGPTLTRLPAADGPLVDAIPIAACEGAVVADQRNVPRPTGAGCDIGAIEVRTAEELPALPDDGQVVPLLLATGVGVVATATGVLLYLRVRRT